MRERCNLNEPDTKSAFVTCHSYAYVDKCNLEKSANAYQFWLQLK